jgi:hypothetical protein
MNPLPLSLVYIMIDLYPVLLSLARIHHTRTSISLHYITRSLLSVLVVEIIDSSCRARITHAHALAYSKVESRVS